MSTNGRITDELYWDAIASKYDDYYQNKWSQLEDCQLQRWLRLLLTGARPSARILDIGCGTGLAYRLLHTELASLNYVGFDVSQRMLSQFADWISDNAKDCQIELLEGRAQQIRNMFSPSTFDFIWSTNTAASFCGSPTMLLHACSNLLRDGGWVFLSYLNRTSLRRTLKFERSIVEVFRTRNSDFQLGGVRAVTVSAHNLKRRCGRADLQRCKLVYQSVLGGVAESPPLYPLENYLSRHIPSLGHSIALIAQKQGTRA